MSYDKSYSDTLYKYDDRDRNNIIDDEVKLPVYEKVTLKFQKGFLSSGIVALIVLLVILTLLKILFHGSSSMSSSGLPDSCKTVSSPATRSPVMTTDTSGSTVTCR